MMVQFFSVEIDFFFKSCNFCLSGHVEGQILLNGCNVDQELMSKISGFVPQKDLSIESLTVQEHLEFMVI